MRTTLDIDEDLLDAVAKATGERSKSKAVGKALEEYVRGRAYDKLLAMAGTMEFDEDWNIWRRTDLGRLREFSIDERDSVRSRPG